MANFRIKTKAAPPSPLMRARPYGNGNFLVFATQTDGFSAYVHRGVLEFIERDARRAAPNEAIGLLAGRICYDLERVPYTLVMAAEGAVGNEADSGPGHVHISPDGRARVRRRLEAAHPDREIVGWYHSHPHHEPRFSSVDAREQSAWADPNHIGIVFSAAQHDEAFGVYRGPQATLLSRRPTEPRSNEGSRTAVTTVKAAPERVIAERAQPDRAKLMYADTRQNAGWHRAKRARFGRLHGVALALLAVLVLLSLAAGVVWLHLRVRSIEKALLSIRGLALSLPAQAAQPDNPSLQQPSPSPSRGAQNNAAPEAGIGTGNQTMLTDEPPLVKDANPLKRRASRRNNQRATKNRKAKARNKNTN